MKRKVFQWLLSVLIATLLVLVIMGGIFPEPIQLAIISVALGSLAGGLVVCIYFLLDAIWEAYS